MAPLADDTARYQANAAYEQSHPECLSDNLTNNDNPDLGSAYWRARNLAARARGTSTPLFITQGFIENNTKPEDVQEYLGNHHGVERGWMGQWEHVRGNETNSQGQLLQGRAGFFDEVMRFYDHYLKGIRPAVHDPAFAIEDSTGAWRAQPAWPTPTSSTVARPVRRPVRRRRSPLTPGRARRTTVGHGTRRRPRATGHPEPGRRRHP